MGLVWDTNMAAVSLFWDTNMAAMTSRENTQLVQSTKFPQRCRVAEESLIYDNVLNNKKKQSSTYVTCLFFETTHFLSYFKMKV